MLKQSSSLEQGITVKCPAPIGCCWHVFRVIGLSLLRSGGALFQNLLGFNLHYNYALPIQECPA